MTPTEPVAQLVAAATVVRFDEELHYMHRADRLRCPRGVILSRPAVPGNPRVGSLRTVEPCGFAIGHDGPCEGSPRLNVERTACGLSMHDAPWTVAPLNAARCPVCFDLAADEQETLC